MCRSADADVAARELPRVPLDDAVAECPRTLERVFEPYDVLVIASFSHGTGEVAAALNVVPYLSGRNVYVLYGNPQTEKEHRAARDEMHRLVGIDPPEKDDDVERKFGDAPSSEPWVWKRRSITYRPIAKLVPGSRPVLILAPHFYWDRELQFARPLPEGSICASWGPLGWNNPDIRENRGMMIALNPNSYRPSPTVDHGDPLLNVPARPRPFATSAATGVEKLVVEAFAERDKFPGSGLACIYGHGTGPDATAVLKRLMETAAAGTRADQWAIIVVVHHKRDTDQDAENLARPKHLRAAISRITRGRWEPAIGPAAESGVYTNRTLRLKVFHMRGLGKECMDWMFRCADLPIMEGANTIQQVMGAGRPFLRVARSNEEFLGKVTDAIKDRFIDGPSVAAMAELKAAAGYLIEADSSLEAATTIRSMLFGLAARGRLDTFAAAVRREIELDMHNPLHILAEYIERTNGEERLSSESRSSEGTGISFQAILPNA